MEFIGQFSLDKKLKINHKKYLDSFSRTRRVARREDGVSGMKDTVRCKVNLPLGEDCSYYVGALELQDKPDKSIINYNQPPKDQPSAWCCWGPSKDGNYIICNTEDSFEYPEKWIKYLISHFLSPWGYKVNGSVKWVDEIKDDAGIIKVIENKVEVIPLSMFK